MEKISVILPIYNVEKYICECIDSIVNQTYKNLEIILVDDGSPDSCPQICDEYAKKDNRIKVIHKINGGVSSARNMALDLARGEYITFVDNVLTVSKEAFVEGTSFGVSIQFEINEAGTIAAGHRNSGCQCGFEYRN